MVELLSPVGSFETLAAAIDAGADSVYFGIKGLNMRSASAKNFDISDLKKIAERCHKNNVKCYLTLNTIVYNHEFPRVRKILEEVKESKVDAIIACDFGVINLAKELDIEIHISTQASIGNIESVKFYSQFSPRVVLARECTLEQIKSMKDELKKENISLELEVFIHGALCVAESGRCFMSQFHNRVSANRGQCLQECRREYKVTDIEEPRREFILDNQFIMSPKDLCALPILDKFVEAGIDCFKIEGRAKGSDYVFKVTKVYKEALKAIKEKTFTKEKVMQWVKELESVYNRGFTHNFIFGTPTNDSWSEIYGNKATTKKEKLGVIKNYYKEKKVALAEVIKDLKKNDLIYITGETTGYKELKLKEIIKHENDEITFPCDFLVRQGDEVYKIINFNRSEANKFLDNYPTHNPFKTPKQK